MSPHSPSEDSPAPSGDGKTQKQEVSLTGQEDWELELPLAVERGMAFFLEHATAFWEECTLQRLTFENNSTPTHRAHFHLPPLGTVVTVMRVLLRDHLDMALPNDHSFKVPFLF